MTTADPHPAQPHRPRRLLVGRERELARLRQVFDDTVAGRGALVLISGEAGIGKTALVNDLVASAREQEALVLTGGCYDLTTTSTYGPWAEALRHYRPQDGRPKVPAWFSNQEEMEKVGSQTALFEEARCFLADVAGHQPLVIVLEDLHWSDGASLDALRYLSRPLRDAGIMLILTYRDDELARRHALYQLLPSLVRETEAERIALRRLDREALNELVRNRYQLAASDQQSLVNHLFDRGEGNPLFAREILEEIESSGSLYPSNDRWVLDAGFERHFPALLQQMFDAKLDRLSPDDLELLVVASALGQKVSYDLWQAVMETGDDRLSETITRADGLNILSEDATRTEYQFTHALMREALYSRGLIPQRRQLHRRIAEVMEQQPRPDPDEVADHYLLAADPRAADWLIRAGDLARRRYAWVVAAEKYERAIPLLPDDHESVRLAGWLRYAAGWLFRVFDHGQSLATLEQARRTGMETNDDVLAACSLGSIGLLRSYTGDLPAGIELMRQGVEQLNELTHGSQKDRFELPPFEITADDPAVQFIGEGNYSGWLTMAGRIRESIERGEASAKRYDSAVERGVPATVATGIDEPPLVGLANAHGLIGNPERASYWANRAKRYHHATGHHLLELAALFVELDRVILPYQTNQIDRREHWQTEADKVFQLCRGSLVANSDAGRFSAAQLSFIEGEWENAASAAEWFAAFAVEHSFKQPMYAVLGWIALYRGDIQNAWLQVSRALPSGLQTEPGSIQYTGTLGVLELASSIALASGDQARARDAIDAHWRWLDYGEAIYTRSSAYLSEGRYQLKFGNRSESRVAAEQARAGAEHPRQPLALLAAHRFLGHLDILDVCLESAGKHLAMALDLADACRVPFERALTQVEVARLRLDAGEYNKAAALLDAAREVCEVLRAQPTLERIESLRQQLDHGDRAEGQNGLSPREVEVLQAVARGLTNSEIADELFISSRTVGSHVTSIYRKLDVKSRAAATRFAVEAGMLSDSDGNRTPSND